jgi:hypothetical protein
VRHRLFYLFSLFFFLFNYPETAYAYVDPGSLSLIMQSILAVIASFFGGVLYFWKNVKNFFVNLKRKIIRKDVSK